MTWKEGLIGIPLAVLGALLLLITAAGMVLTRTDYGRERVRQFALERLNGAIQGRVEVDAFLEGNLLRELRLVGVRIYTPAGEQMAKVDTLHVEYRWADFLIGNVVFPRVTLVAPVARLQQRPSGSWNYEETFGGRGPREEERRQVTEASGPARRIVLREVSIRSGELTLRTPWELGPGESAEGSRLRLERTEQGWERVMGVERLNATLPMARIAASEQVGRLLHIAQFSGRVSIFREPVEVEQLRADLEIRGDSLAFDVWEIALPDSRLFGSGYVITGDPTRFDLTLRANPLSTPDILWLEPGVPLGVASLDLRLRSLEDGTAFQVTNARWSSADAQLSGRFGLRVRETATEFTDVDLEVDRFETELLPALTGWQPPVRGELSGRVALAGPLQRLAMESELRFRPRSGGMPSSLAAAGTLSVVPGERAARALEVRLDTLSMDLVRAFAPGVGLGGRVSGRARLDGRLSDGLDVQLDLVQRHGTRTPSAVRGGGTVATPPDRPARIDVSLRAEPVSLTTLSEYYPTIPFRGRFDGTVRAVGSLADLSVEARLKGAGDSLRVDGRLQLDRPTPRYAAQVQGWRVRLMSFREGLGESDIDFAATLQGEGLTLDDLSASAHAELYSSFIGGVRFDSAYADLRIGDGRLAVDTAVVRSELGRLRAVGALGLRAGVVDSLLVDLESDSLEALNRWLSPSLVALGPQELTEGEVAELAGAGARLSGAARLQGRLTGRLGQFGITGSLLAWRFRYGDLVADSIRVTRFEAADFPEGGRLSAEASARSAGVGDFRFDELQLRGAVLDTLIEAEFQVVNRAGARVAGRLSTVLGEEFTTLNLLDLTIRTGEVAWQLEDSARIRLARSGAIEVDGLRLGSPRGRISARGAVGAAGPVSFSTRIEGIDLAEAARLWPDSLGVAGTLSLSAELGGRVRSPEVDAELEVAEGHLLGVSFSSLRGTAAYRAGEVSLDLEMWREAARLFRLHGTFPLDLQLPGFGVSLPERAIRLTLDGDSIPVSLVSAATEDIESVHGHARASVQIRGSPQDVSLVGQLQLANAGFHVVATGISYTGMTGRVTFRGGRAELEDVSFRGRTGGQASVTGTIGLREWTNPEFDLELTSRSLPAYDQLDARMVVSGTLHLTGSYRQPVVEGRQSVVSGVLFIEEIGRRRDVIDPGEREFLLIDTLFGVEATRGPEAGGFMDRLRADLDIQVVRDTWLRSEESNVEIAGNLNLQLRPDWPEPRISGTLRAVRGDYRFLNKRFEVVEGEIEFAGTEGLNPNLYIVARYRVQTQKGPINIRVVIRGTLEEPALSLESDAQPPIPESDLVSYLLFGRPSYEITRAGGEQGSLVEDVAAGLPHAVFGYALESLFVGEAGIAYVDVSRAPVTGSDGDVAATTTPALAATQVEVGWYLAPTVFVSVAQHLSRAVSLPAVRIEWKLDKNLMLRGVAEPRFGRQGSLDAQAGATDLSESLGLFLFYGWTY